MGFPKVKMNLTAWGARRAPLPSLLLAAALVTLFFPAHAAAQAKKPISKDGLIKAVQINGLSTAELVEQIGQRGVNFQMTPAVEQEMRQAGAREEVIAAARSNYRPGATTASSASTGRGAKPGAAAAVPKGAPLSRAEVVTMLEAGSPPARVEQFVEARGVNFQLNAQATREIKAAGGTNSLVGAIAANYVAPGAPPRGRPAGTPAVNTTAARGPDYDDLTDQATSAYAAKNAALATELLQRAIQLNSSHPRAYQLLGFTQLYLRGDLAGAEQNMRRAIELGGSAAFRVFHDHAEGSFKQTCSGTLFVTKTNVTFKADDGRDTFEALDRDIKEIKTNKFVGANPFGALLGGKGDVGAFHVKTTRNYNFAPLTEKKKESELIIKLVKEYGGVKG
ncbi:MAG TPA: hypothetical protein VD968_01495 [Pyrinomonadaceae bacterium]|nr:hypothetical protein [Pyrinomonadaceae bacterium]